MYAPCGNEEAVAVLDVIFSQSVADGLLFHHFLILVWCELHFQSIVKTGFRSRFQHVPHLGLSLILALSTGRLVVRVYLYAEVAVGIDEFDEQRKFVTKAFVVSLTYEIFFFFVNEFVDILSVAEGLTAWNTGE